MYAANKLPLGEFGAKYIEESQWSHASSEDEHNFTIELHSPSTLPRTDLEGLVELIEETSAADYRASSAGWDYRHKTTEMRQPEMRFLIALAVNPVDRGPNDDDDEGMETHAGFLSFMLTTEGPDAVIYVYEIHLYDWARGQGLGGWLMGVAESIGMKVGVDKAMLTVFASNERAEGFYRRRGYGEDESSPSLSMGRLKSGKVRRPEYYILSKKLKGDENEENEELQVDGSPKSKENVERSARNGKSNGMNGSKIENCLDVLDFQKDEGENEWGDVTSVEDDGYIHDLALIDDDIRKRKEEEEELPMKIADAHGIPYAIW